MFYSVLLAGGRSSRMGSDKAELSFQGSTLQQRAVALLEEIGSERILLSGRSGFVNSVPDIVPGCGPPGGIYSCLQYLSEQNELKDQPLLLVPVDMPLLHAAILRDLLQQLGEADACYYEGEVLPCVLRASVTLRDHLQLLFAESVAPGGKRSLRALLSHGESMKISPAGYAEQAFRNINSPQEFQAILAEQKSGK